MDEGRAEARMPCSEMVDVSWTDRRGREHKKPGNMEDVSHSGLCLLMDEPIPHGTVLRILGSTGEFQARVRYCQFREIGYFLGVEFFAGCRWWPELYRAEHLIDLQALVSRSVRRAIEGSGAGPRADFRS